MGVVWAESVPMHITSLSNRIKEKLVFKGMGGGGGGEALC